MTTGINSILFVCLGNICRSPTAEGVFRQMVAESALPLRTDSAGTSDWHIGNPPDQRAIIAARARGYDISDLRARQVARQDFEEFDLILAMDRANRDNLEALRPAGLQTPVQMFLDYAGTAGAEVPDPYFDGRFDHVIDLIEVASRGLLASLKA